MKRTYNRQNRNNETTKLSIILNKRNNKSNAQTSKKKATVQVFNYSYTRANTCSCSNVKTENSSLLFENYPLPGEGRRPACVKKPTSAG